MAKSKKDLLSWPPKRQLRAQPNNYQAYDGSKLSIEQYLVRIKNLATKKATIVNITIKALGLHRSWRRASYDIDNGARPRVTLDWQESRIDENSQYQGRYGLWRKD